MKKLILSVLGVLTIMLSSVLFVACSDDSKSSSKSGSGDEGDVVGTWKWTFSDEGYTGGYVLKFEDDNTGSFKVFDNYYGVSYTYDMEYAYNEKKEILTMYLYITEGGYRYTETVKAKLRWVNADKIYISIYDDDYDEYDSEEIGPFIRQ